MKHPKVSIIIVNWNGKQYLNECFTSVFNQTYPNCEAFSVNALPQRAAKGCYEVILVDNGSTDGSVEFVKENYPNVRVIELEKNYGFAGGSNVGIKEALKDKNVRYIALLNNDTRVDKNWLYELVKAAESEEKVGICASKILPMNNPNIVSTNRVHELLRKLYNWFMHLYYRLQYGDTAHATACLYKREMLEDIGFFDETFFAYCEDLELSWRAYKKGWKVKYVQNSVVWHKGGGTTKKSKELEREMAFLFARNWARTVKRHANPVQKFVFILVFTKSAVMSYIGMRIGRNNIGAKPYINAFKEVF